MKPEDIIDAMSNIDDDVIDEVQNKRKPKKKGKIWIKWVAVAACFCIIVGAILGHFHFNPPSQVVDPTTENTQPHTQKPVLNSHSLANAVYPVMVKYPVETDFDNGNGELDWKAFSDAYDKWNADAERRQANVAQADKYSHFFTTTTKAFFADTKGENLVYSPVNVYMALSMLAESTDGQTRKQILDLLGTNDITSLRTLANKLWMSNYTDDGLKTNILANSVWLRDGANYNKSTLELLADKYYASTFSGLMGSDEYNKALQNWLNEQTGSLLKEQANEVEFNDSTVLGLASTVYFKGGWQNEFPDYQTKADTFYGSKENEITDFMYQRNTHLPLYTDDRFTATALSFKNSGKMWLILPDEGISPETLIQNGDINPILNGATPKNAHNNTIVNLYMPKFDVASSMDLIDSIKTLGVSDVFDETKADFSPIMPNQSAYVSQINHSARVAVDEKGCTAAAFTVIGVDTEGMIIGEEVDFRLNRPFIFVITSDDSTPLFVGIVNTVK